MADIVDLDATTVTLDDITVSRTKLPDDFELHDELGKGANNRVFKGMLRDRRCVLRAPRRGSDTQQRGSAIWEFRHALRASHLGVGPTLYAGWYARHATREWPSGLYLVMERFDDDLETALCEDPDAMDAATRRRDDIGTAVRACLWTLAEERIFVYDLKPSNLVVRFGEGKDDAVDVRIIDFGRDFCEWSGCLQDPSRNTPHVDMLTRLLDGRDRRDEVVTHVLFATMMVLLSSTTTRVLYDTRSRHRMDAEARASIHPLADSISTLLDGMQGQNVHALRELLRMDEVRGVLRHYHGRRNAGTHRTLQFARGVETGA